MKRKLLFTILMIVSVLGFNLNAQTWTGSEPAAGDFYLYNVGTAKFLNAGDRVAQWGTNACLSANYGLDFTLETNGNGYSLNSKNSNGGSNNYLTTNLWTDGAATAWTFTSVGDKVYNLSVGTSYLAANAAGDDVEMATSGDADNAKWILLSRDSVITAMASATKTNPMNISFLMGAPDFSRNDTRARNGSSWSWTNVGGNATVAGPNAQRGTYGCEFWNNTFDINQTLTGMPDGTYEFKIAGYGTNGTTYIYCNDNEAPFTNTTSASNFSTALDNIADGQYAGNTTGQFVISGGTLKVGVKRSTNTNADWAVFDNAELYYYGLDLSEFADALAAAVAAAEAVEGTVPTAVYNTLAAVVAAQNATYTTVEEYTTATNAIKEATTAAKAFQAGYSRYQTIKTAVLALDDDATKFTGTATVDVTDADAAVEAATTEEGIDAAIALLRADANTFFESVTVTAEINITNVWITNPAPGVSGDTTGWTNSGNPGLQSQLFEYWNVSGATTKQTLANLPKGAYKLTAIAYTRDGMTAYLNAGEDQVALVGCGGVNNRDQGNTWIAQGNGLNELNFTLDAATASLEIGLTADNATGDHWMCWRSFALYFYGDPINALKADLAVAVAAAEALQGQIPSAAYQNLAAVVAANNQDYTTVAEYETAIEAIQTAVNTATALQAKYSRYHEVKTAVLAIDSTIDTTTPDAAADAATTTEELDAAVVSLRSTLLSALPDMTIPTDPGYIDVTAAMVDNASVRFNTNYWIIENYPGFPNANYSNGKCGNNECEFYQQQFKFYQTLALTPGTWEFGVTGFHRAGNHSTYFYAGEDKIIIPGVANTVVNSMAQAETYFNEGNGKVSLKFLIESDQNVEIGIDNQDTETDRWTIFRDFTLKYYGEPDYSVYDQQWFDLVAEVNTAKAAEVNANVTGSELTALNEALANEPVDGDKKDQYLAKIDALRNALNTFKAAATNYNAFVAAKNAATPDLAYAATAKKDAVNTAKAAADATSAADADAKKAAIATALRVYYESHALAEGVDGAVNMTELIGQANAPASQADITAWTYSDNITATDATIANNEQFTQGDNTLGGAYYDGGDLWGQNAYTANYKQNIELTPGKYMLTVTSRASLETKKFELYAGENATEMEKIGAGLADGIFGRGWNDQSVEFEVVGATQNVEIGVNIEQDKAHNWYSFTRFRLVQLEASQVGKLGDINGDDEITIGDLTLFVNMILEGNAPANGDVNEDGTVDAQDIAALANLLVNPVEE